MVSTPSPPDPMVTAAAQSAMNRDTALTQQQIGMVNQVNPWGSVGYEQTGTQGFTDSQGNWVETPTYTQTTSLSPQQQKIFNQSQQATLNLAQLARQQSKKMQDYLGGSIDMSGAPDLMTPNLQGSLRGFNTEFSDQTGVNPNFQQSLQGFNAGFDPSLQGFDQQFSGDMGPGFNAGFDPSLQGFNPAYDPSLQGFQAGFGGEIGGNYGTQLGDAFGTTYAGADDFSADRLRYEEALWERGAADRAAQEDALRNRLINSGIRPGSAAWNSEMERLARQTTDARLATMLAAGDEQARMVGMARDAAMFGNESELARLQAQNAASMGAAQFGSQQQQLGNQASLAQGQFESQQQQLANQAALAQGQFGSQQQQLGNQAAAQQWQANMAAQNAGNEAALAQGQFRSQQQQLGNQALLQAGQFGQQGQALSNEALMGLAQFGSQQQQLSNAAQMAQAGFWNDAQLQQAAAQNAARQQHMGELFGLRNQPINELSALMSGSQVSNPAAMGAALPAQSGVANVDYAGLVNNNYQQQMQQSRGMMGGLFGLGSSIIGAIPWSDARLKTDIRRVGTTDGGVPVYTYRYVWGGPVQMGVMAQDVPEAAVRIGDWLAVDYARVA